MAFWAHFMENPGTLTDAWADEADAWSWRLMLGVRWHGFDRSCFSTGPWVHWSVRKGRSAKILEDFPARAHLQSAFQVASSMQARQQTVVRLASGAGSLNNVAVNLRRRSTFQEHPVCQVCWRCDQPGPSQRCIHQAHNQQAPL